MASGLGSGRLRGTASGGGLGVLGETEEGENTQTFINK